MRLLDDQPEVVYVGGATRALSGLDDESLVTTPGQWDLLVHPEDVAELTQALRAVADVETGWIEYRMVCAEGVVRWLREDLKVLPGSPARAFGVVCDVSREREFREELSGLEERVWRSQRMESLGALLGDVTTEFSDVLNTILATAPLVAEDDGFSAVSRANMRIADLGRLEEAGGPVSLADERSALPVIFTSRAGERALDRQPGLRQWGVFLPKPVEPDVLREAIVQARRGSEERLRDRGLRVTPHDRPCCGSVAKDILVAARVTEGRDCESRARFPVHSEIRCRPPGQPHEQHDRHSGRRDRRPGLRSRIARLSPA